MLKAFQTHIDANLPELKTGKNLVAVSGGLDSVVLTHLCRRVGIKIAVAHCNFGLRGKESAEDAQFVEELAKKLSIQYFVKCFETNTYAKKNKLSIQVAARELRYNWFKELAKTHSFSSVLTAHHRDDALETFLINLSRGTGIKGLAGIPQRHGIIIRPLLPFTRDQIKAFAESERLQWREDSSNEETYYLRNRIRHELVPKLKELHPSFLANFKVTQQYLRDSDAILSQHISEIRSRIFIRKDSYHQIPISELKQLHPFRAYIHALFSDFGFTEWDNVSDMVSGSSGKQLLSKTHRLIKDREYLLLTKKTETKFEAQKFELKTGLIKGRVSFQIEEADRMDPISDSILYVDKETLNHRLEVRKWKKGDYFYPLGMKGKKLVSKYFKDEKMNILQKEAQWLLFSGDRLMWIIGRRADDRFKITPETKQIIRFRLIQ